MKKRYIAERVADRLGIAKREADVEAWAVLESNAEALACSEETAALGLRRFAQTERTTREV